MPSSSNITNSAQSKQQDYPEQFRNSLACGSFVCAVLALTLVPFGCVDSATVPDGELSWLRLEEARLVIREVHETQRREKDLLALQLALRKGLESIEAIRSVDVAVWQAAGQPSTAQFLAAAELDSGKDISLDAALSECVSVARKVLPDETNIVPGWSKPVFGTGPVIVVSGALGE